MIYKVSYHSMTASYGPSYIKAESEDVARLIFAKKGGFSSEEMGLISAHKLTPEEIIEKLLEAS